MSNHVSLLPSLRGLPPHASRMISFQFLNAMNFTIALGAPMVLTAQFLGAREALIGFMLSLTPFFMLLQLPAARMADRLGHKRVMMMGWRARAIALLLVVPLPLLVGRVPGGWLLFAFALILAVFNLIRGFAAGNWLPWVTDLIPARSLGRYVSIEQVLISGGVTLTLLGSGWFLGSAPPAWHYSVLFAVGGIVGLASVKFLGDTPAHGGGTIPQHPPRAGGPLIAGMKRIWAVPAFRRMLRFFLANGLALAPFPGFLVVYLREAGGLGDGRILTLTALTTLGGLLCASLLAGGIDRVGSRPIMRVAGLGHVVLLCFWAVQAAVGASISYEGLIVVFLLAGFCGTAGGIAQGRLVLGGCPRDEVTLALSLYQVLTSLAGGLSTLVWGFILQALRHGEGAWDDRRVFTLFFGLSMLGLLISQRLLDHVKEASALRTSRFLIELFWEWPIRLVSGRWTKQG